MSRGSAGITRNTFVASDSNSSHQPPRNPAATPTTIDSTDAMTPTLSASSSVRRMPVSSWASTSWPLWVVPSRCAASGGCSESPNEGFWNPGS